MKFLIWPATLGAVLGAALGACHAQTPLPAPVSHLPDEPSITITSIDEDASALLDAGSDATYCELACAHLVRLGCSGTRLDCVDVCQDGVDYNLIGLDAITCVIGASDIRAVAFCPGAASFCR